MKRRIVLRAAAVSVGTVLCLGSFGFLAGCKNKAEALVVMTEALNELYNPFYSTAGTDMDVVGQTQISMLSTDTNGELTYGKDEPTVVLDYESRHNETENTTDYYYVIKNGLKFSDGEPLTMNDVMFNLYVYLDPAYTGSTTMYSTDIVGLQEYRTQSATSSDTQDSGIDELANSHAFNRLNELKTVYEDASGISAGKLPSPVRPDTMREEIKRRTVGTSFLEAIGVDPAAPDAQEKGRAQLLQDYEDTLVKFREELRSDYKGANGAYIDEPYKSAKVYYQEKQVATGFDEIVSFMYTENMVTIEYPRDEATSRYDRNKIDRAILEYNPENVKTQEQAIEYVYNANVNNAFDQILDYWATGTQMRTEFVAKAKDVILHAGLKEGELKYKSISGIVSMGHSTNQDKITIAGHEYTIAHEHNDDGTPKNAGEYDILRITINKIDPKAKWNFGFTVAPYHYYSDPKKYPIDIEKEQYGVEWASFDFQTKVLQGTNSWGASKNKIPLGAGPYIASDKNDSKTPTAEGFFSENIVYYIANENFSLNGVDEDAKKFVPKVEKMRYMEISTANALTALESGQVHFVTPQFTRENNDKIAALENKGYGSVNSWQLGYGYIGINAGRVKSLELRKAIMAAMDTSLALQYYQTGSAVNIAWPMSAVSWAYPRKNGAAYDGANPTANMDTDNGHAYTTFTGEDAAVKQINEFMAEAGYSTDGSDSADLDYEFVIAGANMNDHPAYQVFKKAVDILNDRCGWAITLKADANALTKLSTGSLDVWAAAWGSTIDPDMYQVYHKNSTATSVLAWGYDVIKSDSSNEYREEKNILNDLSEVIDDAREIDDSTEQGKKDRAELYKTAMSYVLDLAIELPLYQRKTVYAYNLNVIKEESLPHDAAGKVQINPYTSPLSKIWEIEIND